MLGGSGLGISADFLCLSFLGGLASNHIQNQSGLIPADDEFRAALYMLYFEHLGMFGDVRACVSQKHQRLSRPTSGFVE